MSNMTRLSAKGKVQGLISKGCGPYASTGNKYQINHADEIFASQLDHSSSREYNVVYHPIKFYKPIDKPPPLLNAALSESEELSVVFNFYRISSGGCIERLYIIELQGAHLSNTLTCYPHSITHVGAHLSSILTCYPYSIIHAGNQPEDVIALNYRNIMWKHHIVSTESYGRWEERILQI